MAEVLVLLEAHDQHLRPATTELLTLANQLGQPVGIWAGESGPSDEIVAQLGEWGVNRIDWVRGPAGEDVTQFVAKPMARGVAEIVGDVAPRAVLATSSLANKEFAAHLGFATDSGVLTDLSGIENGDELVARQVIFAGTWNATSQVSAGTPILLFKPGAIEAQKPATGANAQVREVLAAGALQGRSAKVVERTALPEVSGPDLPSATTVVVGVRGTEGDFAAVRELAEELDAAVGATRVATDEGWVDHSLQVGQTGVTITPKLYIGAGVSGAVHHLSGMQASEVIVAINSDSDAPLFEMADFGVVGDLHEILPQAVAELRRLTEK